MLADDGFHGRDVGCIRRSASWKTTTEHRPVDRYGPLADRRTNLFDHHTWHERTCLGDCESRRPDGCGICRIPSHSARLLGPGCNLVFGIEELTVRLSLDICSGQPVLPRSQEKQNNE